MPKRVADLKQSGLQTFGRSLERIKEIRHHPPTAVSTPGLEKRRAFLGDTHALLGLLLKLRRVAEDIGDGRGPGMAHPPRQSNRRERSHTADLSNPAMALHARWCSKERSGRGGTRDRQEVAFTKKDGRGGGRLSWETLWQDPVRSNGGIHYKKPRCWRNCVIYPEELG